MAIASGSVSGIADADARAEIIRRYLPLAKAIALRFADRGEELEDLMQVGAVGLIAAVDRFRPERGRDFAAYAAPTIAGEIRHHLRDRTTVVRVPRRVAELRNRIAEAERRLCAELGRAPTTAELARAVDAGLDEVARLLEGGPTRELEETQHAAEDPYGRAEDRLVAHALLSSLDERRRQILRLRFFEGLSQAEIAHRLGLSQIHVSRLLRSGLEELAGRVEPGG